jgi:hypothetical protein
VRFTLDKDGAAVKINRLPKRLVQAPTGPTTSQGSGGF